MKEELTCAALWQTPDSSLALAYLMKYRYPWEALGAIRDIIEELARRLPRDAYEEREAGVFVAGSASVAPNAILRAPCIICEEAEVRQAAFVRGAALVGRGAVVGNSVELKNCILFDRVQVPHFNYVGDSILGYRAHMGAGAVTSNVKSDKSAVAVRMAGERIETGLRKFGAMLGDEVEVGCNSVLNPGTVVGPRTQIYPLSAVRGYIPSDSIYKNAAEIVAKR